MALLFFSLAAGCAADSGADNNRVTSDDLADAAETQADSTSDDTGTEDVPDTQTSNADDTSELNDIAQSDANTDVDDADECDFGTCVTMCSTPNDCPPGFVCGGTGRCGIQDCVDDVCPNPLYTCDVSNRCARVDCSDGASCPAGTACTGSWCVELRMLPR